MQQKHCTMNQMHPSFRVGIEDSAFMAVELRESGGFRATTARSQAGYNVVAGCSDGCCPAAHRRAIESIWRQQSAEAVEEDDREEDEDIAKESKTPVVVHE